MWGKGHIHRLFTVEGLVILDVIDFIESLIISDMFDLYRLILGNMIDFRYLEITLTANLEVHASLLLSR